jgi:hypothetical protein
MLHDVTVGEDEGRDESKRRKRLPEWCYWVGAAYTVVLLLVVSIQAICLVFLWRPPASLVSFLERFVTSPAIAGFAAIGAAIIGARSISRQLRQTKEKAADDAWWEQFEWVTDRLIPSDRKDPSLPRSLAFRLMTSLSRSTTRAFQSDAVDGILGHYWKESGPKNGDPSELGSNGVQTNEMDETEARALRGLVESMPQTSPSTVPARQALAAYDYESEGIKALRSAGFALEFPKGQHAPDAVVNFGTTPVPIDFKKKLPHSTPTSRTIADRAQKLHDQLNSSKYILITDIPLEDIGSEDTRVVSWNPEEGASALRKHIEVALSK